MSFPCLRRELAVCSAQEVEAFLDSAPDRWAVVSIREPDQPEPLLKAAARVHRVVFEDVLGPLGRHGLGPQPAHLEGIRRFARGNAPLVLQCWAGQSRSTAVALALIVEDLWAQGLEGAALVRQSTDLLLGLRPQARPNKRVLQFGLEPFLPPDLAPTLTAALLREPRLLRNFA